jgi:hypothetical protein
MGWDQEISRQDVQGLLLDLLGVDPCELLRQVIEQKLAEQGLSYEVEEDTDREEGDGMMHAFHPRKIKFSDGRVFVETITESVRSDDWGSDHYGFVEAGKPYKIMHVDYNGEGDEPKVTEEVVPGSDGNVTSLEEIRDKGNALTPGMGDEICDFFDSQGITSINFAPAEECGGGLCAACGGGDGPSKVCDCPNCHGNSNV